MRIFSTEWIAKIKNFLGLDSAIIVQPGGQVLKPLHPVARASSSNTGAGIVVLNQNRFSQGGMNIDTVNNRIYVPVTGMYMVGMHGLGNAGSGNLNVEARVNGVIIPGLRAQDAGSNNDNYSASLPVFIQAGQYVDWFSSLGSNHGNADFNCYWITLIG